MSFLTHEVDAGFVHEAPPVTYFCWAGPDDTLKYDDMKTALAADKVRIDSERPECQLLYCYLTTAQMQAYAARHIMTGFAHKSVVPTNG